MSGKYWDKAWSLVDGCTQCSPGCDNCWSMAIAYRFSKKLITDTGEQLIDCCGKFTGIVAPRFDRLELPLHVKKPTVWSVWNDLFHEDVPVNFLEDALAVMTRCPQHTFLVLTKRAQRLNLMTPDRLRISRTDIWPIKNLWLGVTICTQKEADEKLPIFLQVPGKKFISFEPALEEIDLNRIKISRSFSDSFFPALKNMGGLTEMDLLTLPSGDGISWVVAGAETGPHARPCDPDWLRSIRDQCQAVGVPFWLKQTDKKGNRLLDGREHNERPFKEEI